MQNGTNNRKKIAPIVCTVVVVGLLAIFLASLLYGLVVEACGELLAMGILGMYAAVIVAAMIGVVAALRQRLREIDGGEEEDAKKY